MKIAIIMPLGDKKGGGEKRLLDLMLKSKNSKFEWLVIFQEDGSLVQAIEDLGVQVKIIPAGRLRNLPDVFSSAIKISKILRREGVDIVLSWMWKAHIYGFLSSKLSGLPCLWSQLEVPNDSRLKQITTRLPASGIFINSLASKVILEEMCPGTPIRLVYPGVSLDDFQVSSLPSILEIRRRLGLPLEGPLIGIVGRFQRWKGMHVFVESMPKILQCFPSAHFVMVGGQHSLEPDYEKEIKHQIRRLGLSSQVTLPGAQYNVAQWMKAMDIFVHTSNNEPFGIVVVEAMALGKPVIATMPGGPSEIISDETDGLLIPYGDPSCLARAVLRYLDEPAFASQVGAAAQKRARDFSTDQYAKNFLGALDEFVTQL